MISFLVSALAFADSDGWQQIFLYTILFLVVLINISSAIFQGSTFGMSGKFPPSYIGAQMGGQAMGGIFPALVDISVVAMDIKEEDVGAACFLVSTASEIKDFYEIFKIINLILLAMFYDILCLLL